MPIGRRERLLPNAGRGARAAEQFCARCGARDVPLQKHHWAPRAVFEDADDWPLSYLCKEHHDRWHRKMGRRPRVKTMAPRRASLLKKIQELQNEIEHWQRESEIASEEFVWLYSIGQAAGLLASIDGYPDLMKEVDKWAQKGYGAIREELRVRGLDRQGNGAMVYVYADELATLARQLVREL